MRDASGAVVRTIDCSSEWEKRDPDLVAWLVQETVSAGHSVLVFCATKRVIVPYSMTLSSQQESMLFTRLPDLAFIF